jgi:ubiquinone/menaquinone biosynthesis C-methylase UbiE
MPKQYQKDWEELAKLDSFWAISSSSDKKFNRWKREDFLSSGVKEADWVINRISEKGFDLKLGSALDFGCGIGRITCALAARFREVYGLDISPTMIAQAEKNVPVGKNNVRFILNQADDLNILGDKKFDLVFSTLCLQHIADKDEIKKIIIELARILKPGGVLNFQLPSRAGYSRLKASALKLRGSIYNFCVRRLRLSRPFCYRRLRLTPYMHMNFLGSTEVKKILESSCDKICVLDDNSLVTAYIARKKS